MSDARLDITSKPLKSPARFQALLRKYSQPAALLIPDFTFYRRASNGMPRLWQFQTVAFQAVSAEAQTLGMLIGEDRDAALGPELIPEADGDGSSLANWTGNDAQALLSLVDGAFKVENGDATQAYAQLTVAGLTVGAVYQLTFDNTEFSGASQITAGAVANAVILSSAITTVAGGGLRTRTGVLLVPSAASIAIRLGPNTSTSGHYVRFDNVSVKLIEGNHAGQFTLNPRGTIRRGSDLRRFCWRGDGTDDNLLSSLLPAASFTLMVACEFTAVSDKCAGASVGANFISLGTAADGKATAYMGTTVQAISAASIVGVPGVLWLSVSGTDFYCGWMPFFGSLETVTGTFAGSIPTTQGIRIGAENDDGTAVAFLAGDVYAVFAAAAQFSATDILDAATIMSRP